MIIVFNIFFISLNLLWGHIIRPLHSTLGNCLSFLNPWKIVQKYKNTIINILESLQDDIILRKIILFYEK